MEASKVKITLGGKVTDANFYKCKTALQWIQRNNEGVEISINCFFETQWEEYLKKTQNDKKGVFFSHKAPILTYLNDDVYVGDHEAFFDYALNEFRYFDKQTTTYTMQASNFYRKALEANPTRQYVFLNVVMSQEELELKGEAQRVVIELFSDICPKTCNNFKQLCNGSFVNKAGKKLSYEGAKFHRVVKGMYIQGGSLAPTVEDQASIFDGDFADENFDVKHTEIGLVGMCKKRGFKHTNESQFYITTGVPLTFMDGKHVVFGRVVQGMRVFKLMDKMDTENEKPVKMVGVREAGDFTFDTSKSAPASRASTAAGGAKGGAMAGKLGKFGGAAKKA